jgi:hypothetical protein
MSRDGGEVMRYVVLAIIVASVGCAVDGPDDIGRVSAASIDPTSCEPGVGRVWIGVNPAPGACPAVLPGFGWKWDLYESLGVTADNRRVCRYTFKPPGFAANTAGLPGTLPWLQMECPSLVPLSDPYEPLYTAYHSSYRRQIEWASSLPFVGVGRTRLPRTVRVAIIDSSVDSESGEIEPTMGDNPHGRSIGAAIRELTCPRGRGHASSACVVEFKNYLALDLASGGPAPGGGDYGYPSTAAERIDQAVTDWLPFKTTKALILNVSLGMHHDFVRSGPFVSGVAAEIDVGHGSGQALRAAIQRAQCEGALVIAAVGNGSNNPTEVSNDGAMLPAAWGLEQAGCRTVEGGNGDGSGVALVNHGQMLHAVGGVDGRDQPLLLSRENADTELVAPAFVVMPDNSAPPNPDPTVRLPPMTGTSFGAAAATAVAAIVWGYRPTLTPWNVMNEVYANAQALPGLGPADVCTAPMCRATRRISVCRTVGDVLADACAGAGVPCPAAPPCTPVPAYGGSNPSLATMPVGGRSIPNPGWEIVDDEGTCESDAVYADPEAEPSDEWCPGEHFDDVYAHPFAAVGQPPPGVCPSCTMWYLPDFPVIFHMEISPDWSVETPIIGAVLEIENQMFDLAYAGKENEVMSFDPGTIFDFELPNLAKPEWAKITFLVDGNINGNSGTYSISEQINIIYQ